MSLYLRQIFNQMNVSGQKKYHFASSLAMRKNYPVCFIIIFIKNSTKKWSYIFVL